VCAGTHKYIYIYIWQPEENHVSFLRHCLFCGMCAWCVCVHTYIYAHCSFVSTCWLTGLCACVRAWVCLCVFVCVCVCVCVWVCVCVYVSRWERFLSPTKRLMCIWMYVCFYARLLVYKIFCLLALLFFPSSVKVNFSKSPSQPASERPGFWTIEKGAVKFSALINLLPFYKWLLIVRGLQLLASE
jgi:hypothetical protein